MERIDCVDEWSPTQAAKRCAASQGKRKAIPSNAAELWALRLIGFALFLRRVGWLDWACFSLWVNGAGTAQCSAKKEASQAKQSNQLLSLFFFRKLNSWNLWVMSAERHLRRKTFHSAASSTAPLHSFFGFHLSLLKKRRAAEGNQSIFSFLNKFDWWRCWSSLIINWLKQRQQTKANNLLFGEVSLAAQMASGP